MTAQQRTIASSPLRSRAMAFALAGAFAVGLSSGLLGPRLLIRAPALEGGPVAPAGRAVPAPARSGSAFADVAPGSGGIIVNPVTGFTIGTLIESPVVNPATGFTTGGQLYQSSGTHTRGTSTVATMAN